METTIQKNKDVKKDNLDYLKTLRLPVSMEEIDKFVDYIYDFYNSETGAYKHGFDDKEEIKDAAIYVAKVMCFQLFDTGSIEREITKEVILWNRAYPQFYNQIPGIVRYDMKGVVIGYYPILKPRYWIDLSDYEEDGKSMPKPVEEIIRPKWVLNTKTNILKTI